MFEQLRKRRNSESLIFEYMDQKITYRQFFNRLSYNQAYLRSRGYTDKSIVALKTNSQYEFCISFLSLLSLGCWVIPVSRDVIHNQLQQIIGLTEAVLLKKDEVETLCRSGSIETDYELELPAETTGGVYHMTSGSMGIPKFCIRTIRNLSVEGCSFQETFHLHENTKILSLCPLEHSYALGAALITSVISGSTLHIIDEFIPRKAVYYIEKAKIEMLLLVPVIARMLCLVNFKNKRFDFSSLKIPLTGAGVIMEDIFDLFKKTYNISLLSNYGSTETGGVISSTDKENSKSVGKAMHNVKIKICDEKGNTVETGKTGELYIKCESMFKGYYMQNTEFDNEGYFSPGDYASVDSQGFIYLHGRKTSFINIGGKKVNPAEIEHALMTINEIHDCKVVGTIKKSGNEVIKAFVVCKDLSVKEISKQLEDRICLYKIPSEWHLIDKIPRNSIGKVKMEDLNDLNNKDESDV